MKKKFVDLSECRNGMRLGEDIANRYGAIVAAEGTVINEFIREKLEFLAIRRILVYEEQIQDQISDRKTAFRVFKRNYAATVDTVKNVIDSLAEGKNLDVNKIKDISETVSTSMRENSDIIQCVSAVRTIDEYTYTHCMNVSLFAMLIGKWLNYPEHKTKELVQAGLLHDIGKAKVPAEILNINGKLLPEEFEEVKKHSLYGYRMVENMEGITKEVGMAVLMHHEREDGSGYPLGVRGDQIPEYAKIIAIADVYDAVTSDRAYKSKMTPFEAFKMFENNGFGSFDARIMITFLNNIASYYIGSSVMLSTGEVGEIVHISPHNITKPIVQVNNVCVDLSENQEIVIAQML